MISKWFCINTLRTTGGGGGGVAKSITRAPENRDFCRALKLQLMYIKVEMGVSDNFQAPAWSILPAFIWLELGSTETPTCGVTIKGQNFAENLKAY